jgi:hypothetical protein
MTPFNPIQICSLQSRRRLIPIPRLADNRLETAPVKLQDILTLMIPGMSRTT